MRVQIVRKVVDLKSNEISYPGVSWPDFGVKFKYTGDAELRPYTNGIDGKSDPQIVWNRDEDADGHLTLKSRFVHFSSVRHMGYDVMNLDTNEIIKIDDLSVCCAVHEAMRA